MMRWTRGLLPFAAMPIALGIALGQGQGKTGPEPPATSFGTVTGHVYLAGSNAPARLVNVALQPLGVQPEVYKPGRLPVLGFRVYQTGLDGAYTIPYVVPGSYYVVVTDPGYLSPFTQFTVAELAHPTPEIAQRIAGALPVVGVQPNGISTLDVTLQRGATLSGTVRFDDGTPYSGLRLAVQRHQADGSWEGTPVTADVDGHWLMSGLMAGSIGCAWIFNSPIIARARSSGTAPRRRAGTCIR